jgi:putative ABC transport system permease protein
MLMAVASARLVGRVLLGIGRLEPLTFAAAALLFSAIGLVASYLPARRAMRIQAVDALRHE